MQEEWSDLWASQAAGNTYFYMSVACFVIFRIIIAALQNWDEIKLSLHRLRYARWRAHIRAPARAALNLRVKKE